MGMCSRKDGVLAVIELSRGGVLAVVGLSRGNGECIEKVKERACAKEERMLTGKSDQGGGDREQLHGGGRV